MQYPLDQWELKKKNHLWQSQRQRRQQGGPGKVFFQNNWEPTWSCAFEQRIGSTGDGGKWLCDPHLIAAGVNCTVFSIGSQNDWSFETAVHTLAPQCDIHTFDHTIKNSVRNKPAHVNFHAQGLGPHKAGDVHPMHSLMALAGAFGKTIDVLKIDCEGCEYQVYKDITKPFVRQIVMEIHMGGNTAAHRVNAIFQHMHDAGYVIFHKEPNTIGCGGDCIEYSFLRLDLPTSRAPLKNK